MNKAIEVGAMILGSASLLLVSFLGFAVMSGVPLHEVAVIGSLFEAPENPEGAMDPTPPPTTSVQPGAEGPASASRPNDDPAVRGSLGLMAAYSQPSPYTQAELQELVDELKGQRARLEARELDLDDRERRLEEMEAGYESRIAALQELQGTLDAFQAELIRREVEIKAGEDAIDLANERATLELANVLEGFAVDKRVSLLTQYTPDEAAQIFVAMTEDTRQKTFAELGNKLPAEQAKDYVEAYSKAAKSKAP